MPLSFKDQLNEDILLIQKNWIRLDNNIRKKEYAFNYWILSRIYDLDEELIPELITEYNDKAIDCYAHYEDSKELYIIQNKYYADNTPLNENAFGAKNDVFSKMHKEFKERGFLLQVKPSDKNTFLSTYSTDLQKNPLLDKANTFAKKIDLNFQQLNDLFIPLEKLLQVYIAFIKTGFFAFTKKDMVLKLSSDIYKEYSIKINEELTIDNIIRLYLIYLKAEKARNESEDNKTPIPYYLI